MKTNKLLFLASLLALLCFARPVFADLGISPSDWTEPNGLAGQQIEKTFVLSRSDAGEDLYFTSQISGDINNWITVKNGNSFTMPKGQQQFPVNVVLNIPKEAEKKEYRGEIRLNSTSKTAQSGQIGVLLGALIRIDLTVSDKPFLSYSVQQIEIPEQETGDSVNVVLKILNEGNVLAKPTKVTIDIFDKYNSTKIKSFDITDFSNVAGVGSFSQGDLTFQLPIQLSPEQYWANISVYQDDKLLKTDDLTFNIAAVGTLKKATIATKILSGNNLLIIAGIILAVLVIVAIIIISIWFFRKRVEREKPKEKTIHIKPRGK